MKVLLIYLSSSLALLPAASLAQVSAGQSNATVPDSPTPLQAKIWTADAGPDYRILAPGNTVASAPQFGSPPATSVGSSQAGTKVIELSTGLNFWDGKAYSRSQPVFQPSPQGDAYLALKVQHQVRLSANINVAQAVSVSTPSGLVLNSTPVGIALYDPVGGAFQVIAEITNSTGVQIDATHVLYPDAFAGPGVCASISFALEQDSFSQDVIFTGSLDQTLYGFSTNCWIQIISEFYNPPTPLITQVPISIQQNPVLRRGMASPDLIDEILTFNELNFGTGQAFSLPTGTQPAGTTATVAKQIRTVNGHIYLFESLPFDSMAEALLTLPECVPVGGGHGGLPKNARGKGYAGIPKPPSSSQVKATLPPPASQLALAALTQRPSVVVDYRATLNSGSVTATSDTTFYVSGSLNCSTLTVEGGTVLKYKIGASITVNTLTCKTAQFRPAVFSALDDDTVGESMNGYTTNYTGHINAGGYANPALSLGTTTLNASGCVFRYAQKVIQYTCTTASLVNPAITLTHCQLVNCIRGIDLTWTGSGSSGGTGTISAVFNNALLSGVQNPINMDPNLTLNISPTFINSTVDRVTKLVGGTISGSLSFKATNSIYANITNSTSGTFAGGNNGFFNSAQAFGSPSLTVTASPFQSAGAGNYYLTDGSGFRNQGTISGIPASLQSDLSHRTTYPPTVVANSLLTSAQTLLPQAQRDTDALDLGVHYDPMDYEFGWVLVTNATITVSNGTVIGTFGTNSGNYGLGFGQAAALQSQGTATSPNWIVQYNTVQEQPYTNWYQTTNGMVISEFQGLSPGSTINCRFTDWSILSQAATHVYAPTNTGPINLRDCEFHGGKITTVRPTINFTNCLLERVFTALEPKDSLTTYLRNNLVFGGNFTFAPTNSVVRDNLFDSPVVTNWNSYTGGTNAYVTNLSRLQPASADLILPASPSYQAGPLGKYYLVSSSVLANADSSTTADQVGLYHFTVTTNIVSGLEIKETNSFLDVSYHYVATDTNGIPIDTDGDGIADYIEDVNGNGNPLDDPTSWTNYNSPNGLSSGNGLQVFTPLK